MSRSDLHTIEGGFPVYGENQLRKVNALRRANSMVGVSDSSVPILDKSQVQYLTSEQLQDTPCSCYHCVKFNEKEATCGLYGPRIPVRKFTWPKLRTNDSKPIEYWPVCGAAEPGEPNSGPPSYRDFPYFDPDGGGLCWVNAPKVGLAYSGANCGGGNYGDDCDFYLVPEGTKWDSATGFCRVLQTEVANGDVCASWIDDDILDWRKAVEIIGELDGRS